jgi:nitroreductase
LKGSICLEIQTQTLFNETLKTINERHSIRLFSDKPVSDEAINLILQAANKAPSAHNQQSWRFIVITGEKKRQLVELVSNKANEFPKASSVLLRMASRSIAGAPVVIAVANTGDLIEHGTNLFNIDQQVAYDFFRTMEIQSSAAAVENLLLAATSLGLASVWLGILFLIKDEVLTLLGEPKGEFMAVIPIGYPLKQTKGPEKRPLEMIVKYLN